MTEAAQSKIRPVPYSAESEEYLLSCCLLDGSETIARCLRSEVAPDDFYVPANRLVYAVIISIYGKAPPVTVEVVAQELASTRQLDEVGGFAYLMQISGRLPTTAQADYFIQRVKELATLRRAIVTFTSVIERAYEYDGEIESFIDYATEASRKISRRVSQSEVRSVVDVVMPKEDDDSTLIGDRYICRGSQCITVSGAGMGKSSFSIQEAMTFALGLPHLGMLPKRPLTSLMVQAEDDDGDVGEVVESVKDSLKPDGNPMTAEQLEQIRKRVFIVSDNKTRGEAFLRKLAALVDQVKPDLVYINPLHAYMDGDVKDAESIGRFCREGLNNVNRDNRFAYMVIHHTTKPPSEKVKEKAWNEVMYDMAGSAELINWARAVRIIKAEKTEGDFTLYLAKRGKRANVLTESASGAGYEITTKVPIKHATGTVKVAGRRRPIARIFWEPREETEQPKPEGTRTRGGEMGRPKKANHGELCYCFPSSDSEALTLSSIQRAACDLTGISRRSFYNARSDLMEAGLVTVTDDGGYKRTKRGDAAADEYLKSRP